MLSGFLDVLAFREEYVATFELETEFVLHFLDHVMFV